MIHHKIKISVPKTVVGINELENENQGYLYTYLLENYDEIDPHRRRPVILICPGGGYAMTSDREAEAVAIQYNAMGFHACILRYSCAPAVFPKALYEVANSVRWIREHGDEYGIDQQKVIVSGFSAGGHLAASLGVFYQQDWLQKDTDSTAQMIKPDGLILSYPVISSGEFSHKGSFENLMGGKEDKKLKEMLSLEKQVSKETPPTFLWHTLTDESVPVENSFLFAKALKDQGVSLELHIFPEGEHGLSLANKETMIKETGFGIQKQCEVWIHLAKVWVESL